jgi:hypothetical protein
MRRKRVAQGRGLRVWMGMLVDDFVTPRDKPREEETQSNDEPAEGNTHD